MKQILSKVKCVFNIAFLEKAHRLLFVVSIVGIILSANFFDEDCLVTSGSYKDHLIYVIQFQCGGEDGVGVGIGKILFFCALVITALTEKFNYVSMILHVLILGLQVFVLLNTKLAGMVSYWHTIVYSDAMPILFFFIFLNLYIAMLLVYIIKFLREKQSKLL